MEKAGVLEAAGLDVVVEQGVVRGEVLGLEVARVVRSGDGSVAIEAGVGRFDREAGALLNAGMDETRALAGVIDQVIAVRHRGGPPHAVNRLARERWLRADLLADPALVGCRSLHAVEPVRPRPNLREQSTAPAVGVGIRGDRVLVVCGVGIDLELVPDAAELADQHTPDRVIIAVPPRDLIPTLDALARLLPVPAELLGIPGSWPA